MRKNTKERKRKKKIKYATFKLLLKIAFSFLFGCINNETTMFFCSVILFGMLKTMHRRDKRMTRRTIGEDNDDDEI